jgi:nitrous-oxide reductase
MYYLPTPKNPHGVDVDPTGEYIVAGGKLAAIIPVHSFKKLMAAKDNKENVIRTISGIPVLKYESTLAAEVQKPCLGPLHTEFDGLGYAYTSCFVSSEVVKWKLGTWEVVDRVPAYYSIGHLSISGGDSAKPNPKYLIALNKITKDRYLPVGAEVSQSAQLYLLTPKGMKLLLDFPTTGEPHYAQGIPAALIKNKTQKIYRLDQNDHPYATKKESDAKVVREKDIVHVYMTSIRSHFKPDIVEVNVGDTVFFHVTNLEQDFDIPHGFAVQGSGTSNILVMPGQTKTVRFEAKTPGVFPFYCTDFCSALHQEMQQYIRVKEKGK